MTLRRRSFITGIAGILGAAQAPIYVRSGILMPVRPLLEKWSGFHVEPKLGYCLSDYIYRNMNECGNSLTGPVEIYESTWLV